MPIKVRVQSFSEIIDEIDKMKTHAERVSAISNLPGGVKDFLQWTFDPAVKFQFNTDELTFEPVAYNDGLESALYRIVRSMYAFLGEVTPKKKQLFERTLESVSPRDAKLLIGMVNKKLPYKHIDLRLVAEALPDRFPKSLDLEIEMQESSKPVDEPVKVVNDEKMQHKQTVDNICPECNKDMKTFGVEIMHLKRQHNYTPEQLDVVRAERKSKKEKIRGKDD